MKYFLLTSTNTSVFTEPDQQLRPTRTALTVDQSASVSLNGCSLKTASVCVGVCVCVMG